MRLQIKIEEIKCCLVYLLLFRHELFPLQTDELLILVLFLQNIFVFILEVVHCHFGPEIKICCRGCLVLPRYLLQ